jgi:hypothetical protein
MNLIFTNLVKSTAAILMLASSALAFAQDDPYERCSAMYPAETYGAEERDTFIQECVQSSNQAASTEPTPEPVVETEPPAYDGTVEQYVRDQSGEAPVQ